MRKRIIYNEGMDLVHAVVMAIVEGITEFLPISSTAHLMLTAYFLKIPQSEFVKSFEIFIQLGAILAVVGMYGKRVMTNRKLWMPLTIAFVPTGILGIILYKVVKQYLLGNNLLAAGALIVGAIVMFWWEGKQVKSDKVIERLSFKRLIFIGVCQAVAIVPGVSRAMATVYGGMAVGLSRKEAVEMSFFLAVPTMAAATGLDLVKSSWGFSSFEWIILGVGFAGAFLTAWMAIKWLLLNLQSYKWQGFAVYRVVIAVLWLATYGVS